MPVASSPPATASPGGFIPTCRAEMAARGWAELDVLFVSGDAYVDHPAFGVPLLARLLEAEGYRVGIVAQPDWCDPRALQVMGRPRLCAAISAGAMDSMVNRYTAAKKVRNDDAHTPGGRAGARPDRATIAYTAAVKGAFKGLPTLVGGIEASLRRLAHYDYWDNKVRRSLLVDSKADLLLYGMAESALLEVVHRLQAGESVATIRDVRGTAYLAVTPPPAALALPAYEEVTANPAAYNTAFRLAALESNPANARPLVQAHGERSVVVNPPALPLSEAELDRVYALPFCRQPHPSYTEPIPAYEQIKFSLTAHRGCFGGCAFCAITHHQGKIIQSRSAQSLRAELDRLSTHPEFRGTISDVGGPTANMYGLECGSPPAQAACRRSSCLYPEVCPHLVTAEHKAVSLLRALRAHPAVKHLFVSSGVRFDLLVRQPGYFADLLAHHVSGRLKVAPETVIPAVARIMRKPGPASFSEFLAAFRSRSRQLSRRQTVIPYFISGHPGCTLADMIEVALFLKRHDLRVEQVQEFTPTPGSLATCLWHTGRDPFSGEVVYVAKSLRERRLQKALLLWHLPEQHDDVLAALRQAGRMELAAELLGATDTPRAHHDRQRPRATRRRPKD